MVVQGNQTIKADTFAKIEKYFTAALSLPAQKRSVWLNQLLSDQPELLHEVESLLAAHHDSDSFLTETASLKQAIDEITERCPDLAGRRLGVYEITHKIADGGMGRVYAAERIDGEYEQLVAIKVVEVANLEIELFLKERQLLADLHHPNIVTLLDGGTLKEGFPYLVMEYVEGMPIDRYTIHYGLSQRDIVNLCVDLCEVIEDAHELGIIHCDLKPDNILVINKGNQRGTLKLLDFGIAQSLSASTPDIKRKNTGITPEYASPQRHLRKSVHETDDVFSLGVILGQLLSGQPLSVIHKTNRENKDYRLPDVNALMQHVDNRELTYIIRKATSEGSEERYPSAKALQTDLENWLNHKPIKAASGGLVYRLRKYSYKYRYYVFSIAVFVAAAITMGLIAVQRSEQQVYDNLKEEYAIEAVQDLDHVLKDVPHSPTMEKQMTELTKNWLEDSSREAPDNPIIKKMYAQIMVRLGNVTGHPHYMNLGKVDEASDYYKKALDVYNDLEMSETRDTGRNNNDLVISQLFVKHRIAELETYQDVSSPQKPWQKMISIGNELQDESFISLTQNQRLQILNVLLAGAYEGLRLGDHDQINKLMKAAGQFIRSDEMSSTKTTEEIKFLRAFYYEILGHLYYQQGKTLAALKAYSKVDRPQFNDEPYPGRYRYLMVRVDTSIACLGFQQRKVGRQQQHLKYFDHAYYKLKKLSEDYSDVPMLHKQLDRMRVATESNDSKAGKESFCAEPIKFMMPLTQIAIPNTPVELS